MAEMVVNGSTPSAVAREMNKRGIATTTGAAWQSQRVEQVLTAPRNIGMNVHRGEVIGPGNWEGILDKGVYDEVKTRLTICKARRNPRGRNGTNGTGGRVGLVTGIIHCGVCGGSMIRNGRSYICSKFENQNGDRCSNSATWTHVEEYAKQIAIELAGDAKARKARRVESPNTREAIESEKAELVSLRAEGILSTADFARAVREVHARLEALDEVAAYSMEEQVLGPLVTDPKALEAQWDDLDVDTRHRIVAHFVGRIEVARSDGPGRRFNPARLSWEPRS
jgi:hypothetical protein